MNILISDILKEKGWIDCNLYNPEKQQKKECTKKDTKEDTSLHSLTTQNLCPQQAVCVAQPKPYPKNMTLIV